MSATLFDLTGRRALVTGSARGIGLALARGLASAGAAIVLNGRDRDRLETAASGLRSEGTASRPPSSTAMGQVEDLVGTAAFLASPASDAVSRVMSVSA